MRKKQISTALLVVMVFAIASPIIGSAQASPQTILEVYPETTIVEWGETFTVYVNITDVVDLAAYEFKLTYSPYILEVVEVTKGTFFDDAPQIYLDSVFTGQPTDDADVVEDGILDIYDWIFIIGHWYPGPPIGPCGYDLRADIYPVGGDGRVDIYDAAKFYAAIGNTYTEMPSTILAFFTAVPEMTLPESGSGSLVTITFRAIGFGVTVLDLYRSKLSLICGESIPHEVTDGTVTVLVPPPEEATQDLITTIESWNLDGGVENSLTKQLKAAIHLLNQNNLNGAVKKLEDFINKVEAMRSKKLTDEQADYLIANAQVIIDAIG